MNENMKEWSIIDLWTESKISLFINKIITCLSAENGQNKEREWLKAQNWNLQSYLWESKVWALLVSCLPTGHYAFYALVWSAS